jgi:hypothetical protein
VVDIFLHIAKTGGTTLNTTLRWVYGPSVCRRIPAGRPDEAYRWLEEIEEPLGSEFQLLMGHTQFGVHEYVHEPARYFTMLRHPVRRAVSLYYYIKSGWPKSRYASMSLESFLESDHRSAQSNDQVRVISGIDPDENPSEAIRRAKSNLENEFAAFGITEHFDESLLLFRRTLGWTRLPVYVSSNVNRERPSVEELPESTVDAVREENELDLELYRFANEQFQSTLQKEYPEIERDRERFDRMNRLVDVVGPPALWVYRTGRSLFRRVTS